MATYVNDLRLKEIATGDESGTWGTSTNTNLELIAEAFSFGTEAITTNADTHTTTIADGSTDPGRSIYLKYTGTLDSACTITIGPNTVSKLWFIENGTSGSQNIIISQGSGANVTIPAGHVKAIYSDGAGSGAAMVDAFTDLNLAGTTTIDVLSASGNATISGTLGVTGIVTLTDDLIIGDGKTIGSASDVDAMTIAANGQVTFSQNIIGTLGTAAQTNITSLGTLTTLTVDDITINGSTISDAGNMDFDIGGDLTIDVDGADIKFADGGTEFADHFKDGSDYKIQTTISDGDFIIVGNDGGSAVNAFTLDMSAAGAATFNAGATFNELVTIDGGSSVNTVLHLTSTTANTFLKISDSNTNEGNFIGCTTDDLTFAVRNTERVRIDSTGKVGIGVTDADELLTVAGDVKIKSTNRLHFTNTSDQTSIHAPASNTMAFTTNSSERMRIDSTGHLVLQEGNGIFADTGRTGDVQITGSFTNVLNFNSIGGSTAGTGFYLVTAVRTGASVGTHIVLLVGVSSASLAIIYATLASATMAAEFSNDTLRLRETGGATINVHVTAVPIGITGND